MHFILFVDDFCLKLFFTSWEGGKFLLENCQLEVGVRTCEVKSVFKNTRDKGALSCEPEAEHRRVCHRYSAATRSQKSLEKHQEDVVLSCYKLSLSSDFFSFLFKKKIRNTIGQLVVTLYTIILTQTWMRWDEEALVHRACGWKTSPSMKRKVPMSCQVY